MKIPAPKAEMPAADNTPDRRPQGQAHEVLIDPATGRPVVRDLRFHRFVAHQRDYYFLNESAAQ